MVGTYPNAGVYRRLRPRLVDTRSIVTKAGSVDEIERLASRLEPQLARTILDGLMQMREDVDLDAIVEALQSGDISRVIASLGINPEAAFLDLTPTLQSGVYAAGAYAASAIRLTGAQFAFDQLNPRLISWLQTYSLGLIREITDKTKEAVRGVLVEGMRAGENPREVARDIKGIVGLTERQAKAVQNYRSELETFHERRTGGGYNLGAKIDRVNGYQVLRPDDDGSPMDGITERRLRDFRYDGQLSRAMETGTPLTQAQIDKMVDAYERKYLAYRARTIARTEALRTTNVGIQDAWRQAIEKGSVPEAQTRRLWIVARDERLCEVCAPIPKMNARRGVEFGKPFQTPKGPWNIPPIHPNCRCTVSIRMWEPEQLEDEG